MNYHYAEHRIRGGIAADGPFWEALEDHEFRLPRCAGCARWTWPAHYRCGACGSWDFEWVIVPMRGTVHGWTRTWYPFENVTERAEDIPYVTVLVEVDDTDETRVLGVLRGDDANVFCGARVQGSIDPPSEKTKGHAAVRWTVVPDDTPTADPAAKGI